MKILCWNVNGLRSTLKKDFAQQMWNLDPDIICLQEIKAQQTQMRAPVLDGYHEYWNSSTVKKGYSGTMILSKDKPTSVTNGMPGQAAAGEGRVMIAEYTSFYLCNVYAPNSQDGLKRLPVRLEWDEKLRSTLLTLDEIKPVILCELLAAGFTDAFRHFESGPEHYTFWRFNKGTREKNLGWRIDYFCVSQSIEFAMDNCYLLPQVTGSDHCPVMLELSDSI